MGDINGNEAGVHAERDAINKLKPLVRKNHLESIDLLVIRMSKHNKLLNSKPCANCIENMKNLPKKKGYNLKNIYYSDENGDIIKTRLRILETEDLHYSRFYRQHK